MAGHSKWANIKHRKERADKKKGKIFSRLMKEIISAVRQGGPDPKANAKLRVVLQKAKTANVPNENIERNIKKAASKDQADYFEMTYELYGYGGVGILAEVMTDNKNRIASEMRIATNKCGGNIAAPNAVSYNFEKKAVFKIPVDKVKEEELFLSVTELGAEDFQKEDDLFIVLAPIQQYENLKCYLDEQNIECEESGIEMVPNLKIECSEEDVESNLKLIEWLENIDDVDAIYHNMKLHSS